MEKETLEKLVDEHLSQRQMAEKLNISQTTIRYYLQKYNLKTRTIRNSKNYRCGCGENDEIKFYKTVNTLCKKCHDKYTSERGRGNKERARTYLGGECCNCGYNKYRAALDIHHLDPSKKDPNFGSMRSWSWDRTLIEISNCILLCRNCHSAHHSGELKL